MSAAYLEQVGVIYREPLAFDLFDADVCMAFWNVPVILQTSYGVIATVVVFCA